MKRVKLMLTAIAIIAVVGGALAFKANKSSKVLWCGTTTECLTSFTSSTTIEEPGAIELANPCTQNSGKFSNASSTNSPCAIQPNTLTKFYRVDD